MSNKIFNIEKKENKPKKFISFYNRFKKTRTILVFIGKKINRINLMFERNLLFSYGFRLYKTSNRKLSGMFLKHGVLQQLSKVAGGYSLVAITKRKNSVQNLFNIFNLPYKNIAPAFAITNRTFITVERLNNHLSNILTKKHISGFCAVSPVIGLICAINMFLYSKILFLNK